MPLVMRVSRKQVHGPSRSAHSGYPLTLERRSKLIRTAGDTKK
jgi:hypothetical protein